MRKLRAPRLESRMCGVTWIKNVLGDQSGFKTTPCFFGKHAELARPATLFAVKIIRVQARIQKA